MKTNDTFSISRMGAYLRLVLTEHRKTLLLSAATLFGCLIIVSSVIPWINDTYAGTGIPFDPFLHTEINIYMFLFAIFMAFCGSTFYSLLDGKDARVHTLTVPASNAEKFVSYIIIYSVMAVICFFILSFAADYIRVLTAPLYAAEGAVVRPATLGLVIRCGIPDLPGTNDMAHLMLTLIMSMTAIGNGLFVLGSVVWARRGFMKTFITSIVLWIVMIFTANSSFELFNSNGTVVPRCDMTIDGTITVICCTAALLTAALYWISYVRFKETEIINRW